MFRSRPLRHILFGTTVLLAALLLSPQARADRFTYTDKQGETVNVEARLAGSGQGMHALELDDGSIRLVPQRAVTKREVAEGPEPIDTNEMIERLTEKFGKEKFRAYDRKPYVIGVVLAAPLPKSHESRVRGLLATAATFMRRVETNFMKYARNVRFPTKPPRFPLVLLIFESDDDFETYTKEVTGQRGISAQNIAGFYSGLSNWLSIRLTECSDFEVPLHEAIHQQVYNRHVLQRLGPTPAWFNEGIATGFEGDGTKISGNPTLLNARYALRANKAAAIDWANVVGDDKAFRGDVLAGDAYTHAWSLHWLLVTKYKVAYSNYVKTLAQQQALSKVTAEERTREFEEAFGKSVRELQQEFRQQLEIAIRKQKPKLKNQPRRGYSLTQSNLGEVELKAVRRLDLGGAMFVEGRLKNISPIRDLAFHITVETTAGTYAEWYLPSVKMKKMTALKLQRVNKLMKNAPGGQSATLHVRVRSIPPDSETAATWKRGQLPIPVFGGR